MSVSRSNLFGRKDLLEVYRQAKEFIIRYKLLRMCQCSDEKGLKRLTICNLWRVERKMARCVPSDSICAMRHDLRQTTCAIGRTFPLPPLGKTHTRLVGVSGCAGTPFTRRFAPPVPTISPTGKKPVRRVGYARQF